MPALEQGTKDLVSTLISGAGGVSFFWLLAQTVTKGRVGWLSTVAVPTILCGYSGYTLQTKFGSALPPGWTGLAAIPLGILAGILFDRGSSLKAGAEGWQGWRSPGPLVLWGVGAFGYAFAPLAVYLQGWQPLIDRSSAALLVVSSAVMAGQGLKWVLRLLGFKKADIDMGEKPTKRSGSLVGSMVAMIALLLLIWRV